MNADILTGKWKQLVGGFKQKSADLTDDDWKHADGGCSRSTFGTLGMLLRQKQMHPVSVFWVARQSSIHRYRNNCGFDPASAVDPWPDKSRTKTGDRL